MANQDYCTIPNFILDDLKTCIEAGIVPRIRHGISGNNHTTWRIRFSLWVDRDRGYPKYYDFEAEVVGSYQRFIDYKLVAGPGFDDVAQECTSMAACIELAKAKVAELEAKESST